MERREQIPERKYFICATLDATDLRQNNVQQQNHLYNFVFVIAVVAVVVDVAVVVIVVFYFRLC